MGIVSERFKVGITKLLDEVGQTITLNVPLINNMASKTSYTVTALISNVTSDDIGKSDMITLDTLLCKILIDDLSIQLNCPTSNLKKKNVSITYKNEIYSIAIDGTNSFNNMLILYLNRKS